MHVEKCPVCEGRGHVPQGFYLDLLSTTGTTGPVQCRSCKGMGYICIQDEIKPEIKFRTGTDAPETTSFKIECDGDHSKGNSFTIISGAIETNQ